MTHSDQERSQHEGFYHNDDNSIRADDTEVSRSFDDLLQRLRAFGPYQIKVFVLTSLLDFPGCWVAMFFLFGGYNPGFYCVSEGGKGAVEEGVFTLEKAPNWTWVEDQCTINGTDCAAIVFKSGYHSTLTEWGLVCSHKYVTNFFTTLMMLGILVGASVFGQLADMYGRKHVLYTATILLLASQFIQGMAVNWQMFAALRFFGGMAVAGVVCVGYVLPMEMIGRQWRTVCGSIAFWQLASISMAGLGYLIPNWRHLSYATAAISSPLLLAWFVVPESPRWLVQQNRLQEALKILQQMARENGRPEPTEKDVLQLERTDDVTSKHSIKDMFRTRTLTRRTMLMAYTWFMCNMATYGLAINTRDMGGNIYLNIVILSVTEFFFCISVIYTAKRFGRRPTLLGYEIIAIVCLGISVVLQLVDFDKTLRGTISNLGRASIMASWYIAYLLTAELFPTPIRTLANGSCSVFGRVGGILAPQIAFLSSVHSILPGVVYGVFIAIAITSAAIVLPETKNKPLPDVLPPNRGCCKFSPSDTESGEEEPGEKHKMNCQELEEKETDANPITARL